MILDVAVLKIFLPWITSFFIGFLVTPYVLRNLYSFECWKKEPGNRLGMGDQSGTPIFNELHSERDVNVPRMGGLVIVMSVVTTIVIFWLISYAVSGGPSGSLDFLSRNQTWLPLTAFIAGAIVGFIDDILTIGYSEWFPDRGGLPLRYRMLWASAFAVAASYWYYYKLGIDYVFVPFYGDVIIGPLFIVFFIFVFVSVFATSNIDGLDGLAGGVMSAVFAAYGIIAYFQDQTNIAAFCFVVVGATLAFLWTNIPPAKFYMTEVGYNALSFSLAIVAFATNKVLLLPIIALPLVGTVATTIIQVVSKKIRGKKVFLVAPVHHHFEALGWPAHKVVMRYWIVSIICAALGVILSFTA